MKKILIIGLILILSFTLSNVYAENNMTDDLISIEDDDVNADVILTDDIDTSVDNENPISISQQDNLKESYGTFDELNNLIKNTKTGKTLVLTQDYRMLSEHDYLKINNNIIFDGNGHIIDLNNIDNSYRNLSIRQAIIKNTNFINGYNFGIDVEDAEIINCSFSNFNGVNDGALYCEGKFINIVDSNFTDNLMNKESDGSAIWAFSEKMTITNCNFKDNYASLSSQIGDGGGGAISASNCNLSLSNCTFTNNKFKSNKLSFGGGAIAVRYGALDIDNCNFTNNNLNGNTNSGGGAIFVYTCYNVSIKNTIFDKNSAEYQSGGAIYIHYYRNSEIGIDNCSFTNNNAPNGGAIEFKSESEPNQNNKIKCYNSLFKNNVAKNNGGAIEILANDNYCIVDFDSCLFENNQANIGGALFESNSNISNFDNSKFINNKANDGGAIYVNCSSGEIINTNFEDNYASHNGGAIYWNSTKTTVSHSTFYNNHAQSNGGAIYLNSDDCTVTSSILLNNNATKDGGIYWIGNNGNVKDSILISSLSNPIIYSVYPVNVNYNWWGNTAENDKQEPNVPNNFNIKNWLFLNITSDNETIQLGDYATIKCDLVHLSNFYGIISEYSNNNLPTINFTILTDKGIMDPITLIGGLGETKYLATLLDDSFINLKYDTIEKTINFKVLNNTLNNTSNNNSNNNSSTINNNTQPINTKISTIISSSTVSTVYNGGKYLIVTLKDSNDNPISGQCLSINLNGIKTPTTDSNGQVKLSTNGLLPKSYNVDIVFSGNANYEKSTATVKVTVKKATPKITAKAITFKKSVKTKKYSITLKNNLNKVMKNTKVTIKVNKKTYTAKTNSKGVATFKITKLTKKGTFKSIITYTGNKYYNKVTKTVNIKVK